MEQLFCDLAPSEEELYQRAISQPLGRKVDAAVELLRQFGNGAIVCFSGGKDSVVIKHLARRAGIDCEVVYSNTTIDPPELVHFIQRDHADVKWHNPEMHLLRYMVVAGKGLPSRWGRWCCELYKENTTPGVNIIIGVRAAESLRRKGLWKQINVNRRERGNHIIIAPIVYWRDDDVWHYIRDNALPYCSLYDEGFKRLGCVGCPLGGAASQAREFERWPRYKQLWWRYTVRLWERWHNVPTKSGSPRAFTTFGTPENYFEWWITGKHAKNNQEIEQMALELYGEVPQDADCQSRFMTV